MTVAEFSARHLERKRLEGRKDLEVRAIWLKRFTAWWGTRPIQEISRDDILRWRASLESEGLKPNTVRLGMAYISALLQDVVRDGLLAQNPARGVPRPKATERLRFLSLGETKALLKEAPPWLALYIRLALQTGCRPGELRALREQDVEGAMVHIRADRAKSGRDRYIPLEPEGLEILQELRLLATDGFLVVGPDGQPISKERLARAFRRACWVARIDGATPHTLRHTVASWLAQRGESLYAIGELLGHTSTETTKRYAHLQPEHLRSVVAALATPKD